MKNIWSLEGLLGRDRIWIIGSLAVITVLSWLYLWHLNHGMDMSCMAMPMMSGWSTRDFLLTFMMWSVMMVGMMVPSAAPMVLTFAAVNRRRGERGGPYVSTGIFLGGYLLAWTAFSALATLGEWGLHRAALLNLSTQSVGLRLGGLMLVAAGVFQLTSAKNACLSLCRSPLDFLTTDWREGRMGALKMGLHHGIFCVGCCWLLMALLFVAGVMNLLWVAIIAAFVLAEKLLPQGRWVSLAGAGACLISGFVWLARAFNASHIG